MLHLTRATALCLGASPLRGAAAVQGRLTFATQQSSGPGFPGSGTMSQEEAERTDKNLYQGDKVEDAPKPKSFKPSEEQPSAEDMNQGKGAERIKTPTSPGREQDANEPIGGPM